MMLALRKYGVTSRRYLTVTYRLVTTAPTARTRTCEQIDNHEPSTARQRKHKRKVNCMRETDCQVSYCLETIRYQILFIYSEFVATNLNLSTRSIQQYYFKTINNYKYMKILNFNIFTNTFNKRIPKGLKVKM